MGLGPVMLIVENSQIISIPYYITKLCEAFWLPKVPAMYENVSLVSRSAVRTIRILFSIAAAHRLATYMTRWGYCILGVCLGPRGVHSSNLSYTKLAHSETT